MKLTIDLPPDKLQDLKDEMKYACDRVSVFPRMEELLKNMEC